MDKDQLKSQIEALRNKVWNIQGEEQRARMHELTTLYDQLITLEDDPFESLGYKIRLHMHLKEWEKSEITLEKMLKIWPKNGHTWFMLSEVQYGKGEFAKALESFDKSHQYMSSEFRFDFRAKINRALGRMENAEKDQQVFDDYQANEKAKWDDPNHYYHYK